MVESGKCRGTIKLWVWTMTLFAVGSMLMVCMVSSQSAKAREEMEEERETTMKKSKKKILAKLEKAMKNVKHDPSLGFPVSDPKPNENKILRHILIYNRLSPPNSLRAGEYSNKLDFYAWLDQTPGRGCQIKMEIKAVPTGGFTNVRFPDVDLKAGGAKFKRKDGPDFEELVDEITLRWKGLVTVRHLRMDIPVIMDYHAIEGDFAEFTVKRPKFAGKLAKFDYEAWAKPKDIRWRVGDAAEVKIVINNDKPIKAIPPDGRNRKFKVKMLNSLMSDDEYIQLYMAPLIEEMEGAPMAFLSGLKLEHKLPTFGNPWKKKKWSRGLLKKRGDEDAPYFDAGRFWPYVLCGQLQIVKSMEAFQLTLVAMTIPDICDIWYSTKKSGFASGGKKKPMLDRKGKKLQKKMTKYIKKHVCADIDICEGEDGEPPSKEQKKSKNCGVWPKDFQILFVKPGKLGSAIAFFGDGAQKEYVRYKAHPIMPANTAVTLVFGYFAGLINDGEKYPEINTRFHKPDSYYLKNQFMWIKSAKAGQQMRVRCKNVQKIDSRSCCKVSLPIKKFWKKSHEQEFDLIVLPNSPNIILETWLTRSNSKTMRLRFRKAPFKLLGKRYTTERFCWKGRVEGSYSIRFEIVAACGMFERCQGIGETHKKQKVGKTKHNQMAPDDFKVPHKFEMFVKQSKMKELKIVVEGGGQGDVTQVINEKWFKLRVFFLAMLKGDVTITPRSQFFDFEPESMVWHRGDNPFGAFRARASVDCPSPTRIVVINYKLLDKRGEFEIPTPSFIQVAPSVVDIEEGNDFKSNDTIICNIPEMSPEAQEEGCMGTDGVICGTPEQVAIEVMCEKHPELPLPKCDEKRPKKPDDSEKKRFQMIMLCALYSAIGIMVFTVVYRNLCGGDGKALNMLKGAMEDLNKELDTRPVPEDAVDADEFLALAGFDAEEVFSKDNPNPIVIAQAGLSLEKMLKQMKAS